MIDQGQLFHIPNPCRNICENNSKGFCKGCFRSRQERFYWNEFTDFQKHLVVQQCSLRERRLLAAIRQKREEERLAQQRQKTQFDLFGEAVVFEDDSAIEQVDEPSPQLPLI